MVSDCMCGVWSAGATTRLEIVHRASPGLARRLVVRRSRAALTETDSWDRERIVETACRRVTEPARIPSYDRVHAIHRALRTA